MHLASLGRHSALTVCNTLLQVNIALIFLALAVSKNKGFFKSTEEYLIYFDINIKRGRHFLMETRDQEDSVKLPDSNKQLYILKDWLK